MSTMMVISFVADCKGGKVFSFSLAPEAHPAEMVAAWRADKVRSTPVLKQTGQPMSPGAPKWGGTP